MNQNPEISQQYSLWNQMGSKVILGNLLVIPIEDSLLYVEPLYIRAQDGQLPELQRVLASYSDRAVMGERSRQYTGVPVQGRGRCGRRRPSQSFNQCIQRSPVRQATWA